MIKILKKRIYSTTSFKNCKIPQDNSQAIFVDGLKGSLRTFFLSYLAEEHHKPVVFLTSNQDSAEKMRDDLEVLLEDKRVVFFPSNEREPYDDHDLNPSLLKLRLETLQYLIESGEGVVVCTLEGIMSKVPRPEVFIDHEYYIKINSNYNFDQILKSLGNAGYSREEIVEDVGHFAVRGGIVDVFPWTSSDPVRIEFFGNQVESIRTFNVISQRSIENIEAIELLPNLPLEDNTSSLFDYFPNNSILLIEDRIVFNDQVQLFEDQILASYNRLLKEDIYPQEPAL